MKKKKLKKTIEGLVFNLQQRETQIGFLKADIHKLLYGSITEVESIKIKYQFKKDIEDIIFSGEIKTYLDSPFFRGVLERVDHERFIYENGYPKHGWFGCHEGHLNEKMDRADEVNWTWKYPFKPVFKSLEKQWSSPPKFHNYADPHTQILMNEVTRDAIYADFKNPERNRAFERNKNEGSLEYYRYRGNSATEPFTY